MYKLVRFSGSRVLSPVCCLESCDLDTDSYRDGSRRQLRLSRMSTDINLMKIVLDRCRWYKSSELGCELSSEQLRAVDRSEYR